MGWEEGKWALVGTDAVEQALSSRPRPAVVERFRGCFGDPAPEDVLDEEKYGPCPPLLKGIPGLLGWFPLTDTEQYGEAGAVVYQAFYTHTRAWGWRGEIWSQRLAPLHPWDSRKPQHWPTPPTRVALVGVHRPNCEELFKGMAQQWIDLACDGRVPATDPSRPLSGQQWLGRT